MIAVLFYYMSCTRCKDCVVLALLELLSFSVEAANACYLVSKASEVSQEQHACTPNSDARKRQHRVSSYTSIAMCCKKRSRCS